MSFYEGFRSAVHFIQSSHPGIFYLLDRAIHDMYYIICITYQTPTWSNNILLFDLCIAYHITNSLGVYTRGLSRHFFVQISAQNLSKILNV